MTECTRCGDCCESIWFSGTKVLLRERLANGHYSPAPDADDDEVQRLAAAHHEAVFLLEHWHRVGGGGKNTLFSCDQFDATTRLCTAHDDRPAICRAYPWYGKGPTATVARKLPQRCAFRADAGVPVELTTRPG